MYPFQKYSKCKIVQLHNFIYRLIGAAKMINGNTPLFIRTQIVCYHFFAPSICLETANAYFCSFVAKFVKNFCKTKYFVLIKVVCKLKCNTIYHPLATTSLKMQKCRNILKFSESDIILVIQDLSIRVMI